MEKKKKVEIDAEVVLDGWQNVSTGVGIPGKDKTLSSRVAWRRTDQNLAEALFSGDDLGGKIASVIPFDGTREGITWQLSGDEEESKSDIVKFLDSEFERLEVWKKFSWAWTLARVYGGSLVLMVVDDGEADLSQPMNLDRVRSLKALHVIDRWALDTRSSEIISDLTDPAYGTPEFYNYNTSTEAGLSAEYIKIHHSRVLRFDGIELPVRLYKKNDYWHDSVYGRLLTAIRNYSNSQDSVPTIIAELNQPVFSIEGLNEAIQMDQSELVVSKLNFVNMMRSTLRAIVLDGKDEFDFKQVAVSGVKDLINIPKERLIAASNIPHTRLLGESPGSSLGEQGRSQLIDYYDYVSANQKITLKGPIKRLTEVLFSQIESGMNLPESLTFQFDPLYQDSQETIIRTRQMQADIDTKYMASGVYDSYETAENRFGAGEYSFETTIEEKDRDDFDQDDVDENTSEEKENEEEEENEEEDS